MQFTLAALKEHFLSLKQQVPYFTNLEVIAALQYKEFWTVSPRQKLQYKCLKPDNLNMANSKLHVHVWMTCNNIHI